MDSLGEAKYTLHWPKFGGREVNGRGTFGVTGVLLALNLFCEEGEVKRVLVGVVAGLLLLEMKDEFWDGGIEEGVL